MSRADKPVAARNSDALDVWQVFGHETEPL